MARYLNEWYVESCLNTEMFFARSCWLVGRDDRLKMKVMVCQHWHCSCQSESWDWIHQTWTALLYVWVKNGLNC